MNTLLKISFGVLPSGEVDLLVVGKSPKGNIFFIGVPEVLRDDVKAEINNIINQDDFDGTKPVIHARVDSKLPF